MHFLEAVFSELFPSFLYSNHKYKFAGELQEIYSAANINCRAMEDHMESVVKFLHQQRYGNYELKTL